MQHIPVTFDYEGKWYQGHLMGEKNRWDLYIGKRYWGGVWVTNNPQVGTRFNADKLGGRKLEAFFEAVIISWYDSSVPFDQKRGWFED